MSVVKNKSTEENREFWSHVEAVAEDVKKWPNWTGVSQGDKKDQHVEIECPEPKGNGCSPRR
jgi:hypothetical protein